MVERAAQDPEFEALLRHIQESRALDFRGYKRTSLRRRITLRMEATSAENYAAYRSYLEAQPSEYEELLNTVLINVTSFFRDEEAWGVIRDTVIPDILANAEDDRPIRVWSVGCASGEEPYSVAMLLAEAMGVSEFCRRVKIYATDLDEEALKVARIATYMPRDVESVPRDYLEKYFERTNNHYVFERELRKCVIFGRHNVVHDAPISRIDLLACRNLLIYLEAETRADARVEERTVQIREINAALRATEGSLRTIADLVPDLLWRADSSGEANWFNQRWFDYTGHAPDEPMGEGWVDALHPLDRKAALADWQHAVAGGIPCQQQQRIRDSRGEYRWFLIRAEPMRDEQGEIHAWFAAGTDLHEQRTAMQALQQSELRFRTLVEGMPQLVWRAVDGGKWTWSSPQWSAFTGQPEADSFAEGWLDMLHPDDRAGAIDAWKRAQRSGSLDFEGRLFRADERRYRHFRTRALPVRDAEGRFVEWLGTSTDVDDILQLQAEQHVLVGELQHRTRNLMAVVQAIVRRTVQGSTSLDDFGTCIDERLQALARVQGLLSRRENGMRVAFDALIREELSAHVALDAKGKSEQVTLTGPEGVRLRSATVQTLALALHELATNAVKYGALSQLGGHLDIWWEVREAQAGGRRLFVDWRERGVTDVPDAGAEARGGGYGRELIERALSYQLGARTSYAFEPDGVHCTIDVRVPVDDLVLEQAYG